MTDFATLSLPEPLAKAVAALEFTRMTPVQAESLPAILAGRDVTAQAQTGSGKTAAFGLGLLASLDATTLRLQALVLCPTRELADQVAKDLRALARFIPNVKILTLVGGIGLGPQIASLEQHDPHIVVGTPGRVQELMRKGHLHLGGVKTLVLDEADRMLDMGFEEAIDDIVKRLPGNRQTLLFSATFNDEIRAVGAKLQRDAQEVTIESQAAPAIEQVFIETPLENKVDALLDALVDGRYESALVFCNTRRDTDDVAAELDRRGVSAIAIHGEFDQRERDEALVRFANRSVSVLVATDVAARGLDIRELPVVISYELPHDPAVHVHRIGRTGRAGESGHALALVAPRELHRAKGIEEAQPTAVQWRTARNGGGRHRPALPPMVTLAIDGGRKDKVRPGDILGALTGDAKLDAKSVGKIDLFPTRSYVAIRREDASHALRALSEHGVKGRKFRVRKIG